MKKKVLSIVAVVLVLCCAIGGTLAWLTAKSDDVVNTFTPSNIKIGLEEKAGGEKHEFKMVPGWTITKDPAAWVETGSEDCYLFVKLTWANNTFGTDKTYLSYVPTTGWTQLPGENGVYYREVTTGDMGTKYPVLKDNQVTVSGDVTEAEMTALENGTAVKPTLTVTAYASQLYSSAGVKFTPAEAWANAPKG